MAADLLLLEQGEPALRLYGWKPACLSLGRLQKDDWVDRALLAEAGIDLVRRPSGGRALFHGEELTYALVLPEAGKLGLEEAFRGITGSLGAALGILGVPVRQAPASGTRAAAPPSRSFPGCHSVARAGELVDDLGRKLVGSAQVRRGTTMLQHGSIPYRQPWNLLARLIPGTEPSIDLFGLGTSALEIRALAAALGTVLRVDWNERAFDNREHRWLEKHSVPAG